MSDISNRDLASELLSPPPKATDAITFRTGTVTAVSSSTATVSTGGTSIAGVSFYKSAMPVVGSVVEMIIVGNVPRIIGIVGGITLYIPTVFGGGWTQGNQGALGYPLAIWRDSAGMVHLEGELTPGATGDADPLITLPVPFRPPSRRSFPALSNNLFAWFGIRSDGTLDTHGAVGTTYFSFNAAHYRGA